MEFFTCPCEERGRVFVDGKDQGFNKDEVGRLLTKQCNPGRHKIELKCLEDKHCHPVETVIMDTDPISPTEVKFQCA